MPELLIEVVRADLHKHIEPGRSASGQKYFKGGILIYGVKTPVVNQISKSFFPEIEALEKAEVWRLCEALWASGYLEESLVACNWSYRLRKKFSREDFYVFETWLSRYVNNWASCDTLCNHTIGTVVEKNPELIEVLMRWAGAENRWLRRASAVTLIVPARKGLFLSGILQIAEILLTDQDDMVQKGYGWLLKVAAEVYQEEVFDFVVNRRHKMPRTALRYAIEKMPAGLKAAAMRK
ncbi:DNA alkylation repair protein [Ravibacter arvi]|uniref:DNA alkylation repair protein n=1 Tax=Ravibacter arvi TaxID=2051041 RepID=A0ABP8LSQ3_9BACT